MRSLKLKKKLKLKALAHQAFLIVQTTGEMISDNKKELINLLIETSDPDSVWSMFKQLEDKDALKFIETKYFNYD